jgi:hypothetical protein
MRQGKSAFGYRNASLPRLIIWRDGQLCHGFFQNSPGARGLKQSRAAEDDDGRTNPLFRLNQFRFEQFQPQPQGAKLIPLEKVDVVIGRNIRG